MSKAVVPQQYVDAVTQVLQLAKKEGATQTEVSVGYEKGFTVSVRQGKVETLEYHREKGVHVTVYFGYRTASASTNDLSLNSLEETVKKAARIAKAVEEDEFAGLADPTFLAHKYPELELYYPWSINPEQAIHIATDCEAHAMSKDKRITNSEGVSVVTSEHWHVYANSNGFLGHYPTTHHSINCSLIAEDGHQMQRDHEYTLARDPADLQNTTQLANQTVEKTVKRLGARRIDTRKAPVIFHSDVAKGFLGTFISAISGGNLYREASFLHDSLGKAVFPSFISIEQQPHLDKMMGSAPFDSEGVKTEKLSYVNEGMVRSYVLSSYSARRLKLQPTGNANGVHNLFITKQVENLPDLIKKMHTGFLVTELIGQGVNIMTGDYSRGAFGYWVENGEIQHPVQEVTIAGNLKDMYSHLVAVAGDTDHRGNIHTGSILLEEMTIAGQ